MRTLLFALFLQISSQSFFENAGLAFEEKRPLELFNPPTEVHFYRTFATKPTTEIRERIQACISPENQPTENQENQASFKIMANQILEEVQMLWTHALSDLQTAAGSRERRSFWSTTKQVTRFLYKSPFLRSLLSVSSSTVGNIITAFADQDHYRQLTHLEHKIINNTNLIKNSNNVLLAQLLDLEHQHCIEHNELFLHQMITDIIKSIENEILAVTLGQIPPQTSFVNGLLSSCSKIGNSPKFCHTLLRNNLIEIHFDGLDFDEKSQILISKTILKIPIQKESEKTVIIYFKKAQSLLQEHFEGIQEHLKEQQTRI